MLRERFDSMVPYSFAVGLRVLLRVALPPISTVFLPGLSAFSVLKGLGLVVRNCAVLLAAKQAELAVVVPSERFVLLQLDNLWVGFQILF